MTASTRDGPRLVLCSAFSQRPPGELPAATWVRRPLEWQSSARSVYQLAAGLWALGYPAELRGDLDRAIIDELCREAGVAPPPEAASRPPTPDDMVLVADEEIRPGVIGDVLLGGAGVVRLQTGPTFKGWSFLDGADLGPGDAPGRRAESLRAADALGLPLWTQERQLADQALETGVPATWIGWGSPSPRAAPRKYIDLALLPDASGRDSLEWVVAELPEFTLLTIGSESGQPLERALGRARILVWPAGPDSAPQLWRRARLLETLPVGIGAASARAPLGYVLAQDKEGMAHEIRSLLNDRSRLRDLAHAAGESTRAEADWTTFLARLADALAALPRPLTGPALRQIGMALRSDESVAGVTPGPPAAPRPGRARHLLGQALRAAHLERVAAR